MEFVRFIRNLYVSVSSAISNIDVRISRIKRPAIIAPGLLKGPRKGLFYSPYKGCQSSDLYRIPEEKMFLKNGFLSYNLTPTSLVYTINIILTYVAKTEDRSSQIIN